MQVIFTVKQIENKTSFHTQIDILLKTVLNYRYKTGLSTPESVMKMLKGNVKSCFDDFSGIIHRQPFK